MHKVIFLMLVLFSVYMLHICDAKKATNEDRAPGNDRRESEEVPQKKSETDEDNKEHVRKNKIHNRKSELQKNMEMPMSRFFSKRKINKIVQLCTEWAADKERGKTTFHDYVKKSLENNKRKSEPDEDNKDVHNNPRKDDKSHNKKDQLEGKRDRTRLRLSHKKIVQLCTKWAAGTDDERETTKFEKFLKDVKNNQKKPEKFSKAKRIRKGNKQ